MLLGVADRDRAKQIMQRQAGVVLLVARRDSRNYEHGESVSEARPSSTKQRAVALGLDVGEIGPSRVEDPRSISESGVGVSVLLRQAEVGEAALLVRVENEPRDLAAADVKQVRCLRPHFPELHSTPLTASNDMEEHKDALIVELPILIHFGAVLLPSAEKAAPDRCHGGQPIPAAGFGAKISDHELDLGVRPLRRAEVAAPPRRVDRANELYVLLRHPPRIIPRRGGHAVAVI